MFYRAEKVSKHRPALLRLEDVGPGGPYRTVEDLGRLRTIFTYLQTENAPFHVALIPRWKNIQPDSSWYEKGIDDPNPDEYVRKFIALLQNAEKHGAIFGMHGYTHQYGDSKREDNNQDSGTGSEFNVKDAPETNTPAYTIDRITKSLTAFKKANLHPSFWETPHYNNTREQEKIFESFISVLYQPDVSLHALTDLYLTESGSVYIPTPLDYIHEQNTVEQVLAKLPTFQGLASMFYHPFLEFPFLEPVKDSAGNPVLRDRLPVYRYRSGEESNLHRLIKGFRQRGFRWVSLYEILPFQPVHRMILTPWIACHYCYWTYTAMD